MNSLAAHYATLILREQGERLRALRTAGWERLQQVSLHAIDLSEEVPPTTHTYDLRPWILPEAVHSFLVFVNGRLRLDLSDCTALQGQIVIQEFAEATRSFGGIITQQVQTHLKESAPDDNILLNLALHEQGVFLYLLPHHTVSSVLQCIQIVDSFAQEGRIFPRIHLVVGTGSTLTFHLSNVAFTSNPTLHTHGVVDIVLDSASCLTSYHRRAHEMGTCTDSLRVRQKQDSQWKAFFYDAIPCHSSLNIRSTLQGVGATVELFGLAQLRQQAHLQQRIVVEHAAAHTTSLQTFRAVLKDRAFARFASTVYMLPGADKGVARQAHHSLLLSPEAHAESAPHLEIGTTDVKAGHGATMTRPNPQQMFYLATRGIPPEQANALLVDGFCHLIRQESPHPHFLQ